MFFCDRCAEERKWPQSMFKSHGNCEVCRQPAVCNDVPSSHLPTPSRRELDDVASGARSVEHPGARHPLRPDDHGGTS